MVIEKNVYLGKLDWIFCREKPRVKIMPWTRARVKFFSWNIIRSQEKNLNLNRDSNFGPPDLYHLSYPGSPASSRSNLTLETDATLARHCGQRLYLPYVNHRRTNLAFKAWIMNPNHIIKWKQTYNLCLHYHC
jgi:hypothetical protein